MRNARMSPARSRSPLSCSDLAAVEGKAIPVSMKNSQQISFDGGFMKKSRGFSRNHKIYLRHFDGSGKGSAHELRVGRPVEAGRLSGVQKDAQGCSITSSRRMILPENRVRDHTQKDGHAGKQLPDCGGDRR
ncbi:hypothetical protein [Mesorhizobium sp. M0800]|uniref:hypothetical protein n=1 Tax=Mesorhizobium sp. M0800 TaxID=2957000 RepID=UPI00333AAD6A